MDAAPREFELVLADRRVTGVWDRLARYCGLVWSGGEPEVWAYSYYDAVPTGDADRISPIDVLAAGSLHPGLSRADLAYFVEHDGRLAKWLADTPRDLPLAEAPDEILGHLGGITEWEDVPSFSLLTKVLHRKRPTLVPLVDREIVDWYRPVTGERKVTAAWPGLLRALRADLTWNRHTLQRVSARLETALPHPVTPVRIVDIAVWMGGRR